MLAERLPGLLPPLSRQEALEVTAVHSVAGLLPEGEPLVELPPFQDPHHTATVASIVGGGSGIARPGAASLAHRGVLFLDEAPEFSSRVLDALRQPLESGRLSITRVGGTAVYPAAFSLLLAANPCPCAKPDGDCSCPPDTRRRYLARLSGPLLDRVDMHVEVPQITLTELLADTGHTETTAVVAARVRAARSRARTRLAGTPWRTNSQVPAVELRRRWPLPRACTATADVALDRGRLTARGYGRVLRLAWTLADLQDCDRPGREHVDHALRFRLGTAVGGLAA
jgi:magnesium chelatase family protein